jgi:hypothetical protein
MCDKCVELDERIAHYRDLAAAVADPLTIERISDLIKDMEAIKRSVLSEVPRGSRKRRERGMPKRAGFCG